MATRYPLIVNSSSNQIQEIPFGDTLSLVGNDVDQIIVSGISTLGRVTISSGIVTASSGIVTYYGDGSKLSSISVASTAISDSTAAGRSLLTAADAAAQRTILAAAPLYPIRQTLTATSGTYSIDVTTGQEFLTGTAIAGATTINLSGLTSLPTNGVWRGVLRFSYTSGTISWFTGNSAYTVKWDGGTAIVPTAGEQEAVIIEVVGGGTVIEVAALRGRA